MPIDAPTPTTAPPTATETARTIAWIEELSVALTVTFPTLESTLSAA